MSPVLNINPLAQGGEGYYLTTVASGTEDYYLGSGEAPGHWTGEAAATFDLDGQVAGEDLRLVLAGRDPRTGETVIGGGRGRPRTVPGYDATFRAPKSVSLLWALSDPHVSRQVRAAHDEAVEQAVGYLERNAAFIRRDGRQVPVAGVVAAAFRHRTSRAGDPLLHTHVLIANLARGPDGRWRALDGRALYNHARTAGFVYQAVLRRELTVRLGVDWGPVTNGYADIAGIPRNLIRHFSTRLAEIQALLAERGETSAKAAQMATLATRRAKKKPPPETALPAPGSKDYGVDPGGLQQGWRQRAEPLGWNAQRMRTLLGRARYLPLDAARAEAIALDLAGPEGLTRHASSFTRRDAVRGWAERTPHGASAHQLEALADALLDNDSGEGGVAVELRTGSARPGGAEAAAVASVIQALAGRLDSIGAELHDSPLLAEAIGRALTAGIAPPDLVHALTARELHTAQDAVSVLVWRARLLTGGHQPDSADRLAGQSVIRRADGRAVAAQPGEARYSTPDLLALEQRIIDAALARRTAHAGIADPHAAAAAVAARPSLTAEQADMVRRLASSGAGVEVVVGPAGTGKTYALAAARQAWQASGRRVIGAALAARAAQQLEAGAGISSSTIERLLLDADRTGQGLASGSVLVLDEAGMIGTRQLARVLDHAERADAKVVLVGDPAQLPEIDAGGVFRGLLTRLQPVELRINRRQRHEWDRQALQQLRYGKIEQAITSFNRAGRITIADDADQARQRLVDDWWAAHHGQAETTATAQGIMLAVRRADVDDLNTLARQKLLKAGRLGDQTITAAGRDFAAGDAVICGRNDPVYKVTNGTRGHITAVDQQAGSVTIRTPEGNVRTLGNAYLARGDLTHGYAITGHKAQGLTVERAWVLGSDVLYQEWAYTALSRHRETAQLYIVGEPELPDWVEHPAAHAPDNADPLQRLARSMSISRSQLLAVDQGQLRPADLHGGDHDRARPALRARLTAALTSAHDRTPTADPNAAPADDLEGWLASVNQEPPTWLTTALGTTPADPSLSSVWRAAGAAVEGYRRRWNVNDTDDGLGAAPTSAEQTADYRHTRNTLRAAQQQLGVTPRPVQPDLGLAV